MRIIMNKFKAENEYNGFKWYSYIHRGRKVGVFFLNSDSYNEKSFKEFVNNKNKNPDKIIHRIESDLPFKPMNTEKTCKDLNLNFMFYYVPKGKEKVRNKYFINYLNKIIDNQNGIPIHYKFDKNQLSLNASVIKNGVFENISFDVNKNKIASEYIKNRYEFINKKFKKPSDEQMRTLWISPIGQSIINNLSNITKTMFQKWCHKINENIDKHHIEFKVPMMEESIGIESISFFYDPFYHKINLSMYNEKFEYSEYRKSIDIIIYQRLNKLLVTAYEGKNLNEIINIPGADKLKIRNADLKEIDDQKYIKIRSIGILKKVIQAELKPLSDDYCKKEINIIIGPNKIIQSMDYGCLYILENMNLEEKLLTLKYIINAREFNSNIFFNYENPWRMRINNNLIYITNTSNIKINKNFISNEN